MQEYKVKSRGQADADEQQEKKGQGPLAHH